MWTIETMDGASGGSPWGDQSLTPAVDTDGNGYQEILLGTAFGAQSGEQERRRRAIERRFQDRRSDGRSSSFWLAAEVIFNLADVPGAREARRHR